MEPMAKYKIDHKTMTPQEIYQKQQDWADYVRKRLRPEKACSKCKQTFPNDRAHFSVNLQGRLLGVCVNCGPMHPKPGAFKGKERCPCCENLSSLVVDRHAPAPVQVCRSCLALINSLDASAPQTLSRMEEYIAWRKRGQLARFTLNPDRPAQPQEKGASPT